MKILLRRYYDLEYVWVTAKYNGKYFVVGEDEHPEVNVISVMNDNRKNYIRCSNCGQIFPKRGNKFDMHKKLSSGIDACMKCRSLYVRHAKEDKCRYSQNADGTFTQNRMSTVRLMCTANYCDYDITSQDAISRCKFRQCENASETAITDIFLEKPGIFDAMITVDKILDNRNKEIICESSAFTDYLVNEELCLIARVNRIGIVDKWIIGTNDGYDEMFYYSKKYNELYRADYSEKYALMPFMNEDEIKQYLANLYK